MKKLGTSAKPSPVSAETSGDEGREGRANVAKRLARVAGHATSLQRMWDEGCECKEMLTRSTAVRVNGSK